MTQTIGKEELGAKGSKGFGAEVTDEVLAGFTGGRSCRVQIFRDSDGNIEEVRTTGNCGHVKIEVK